MVAHGYGRSTYDVDLVIRLIPDVIHRAFDALASLGYRPRVPVTADGFADLDTRNGWIADKGMMVLNFHSDFHRETPIDVFVSEPFDFSAEYAGALVQELAEGLQVRFLQLSSLLKMKAEAGRPKDLADIAELQLANS